MAWPTIVSQVTLAYSAPVVIAAGPRNMNGLAHVLET